MTPSLGDLLLLEYDLHILGCCLTLLLYFLFTTKLLTTKLFTTKLLTTKLFTTKLFTINGKLFTTKLFTSKSTNDCMFFHLKFNKFNEIITYCYL